MDINIKMDYESRRAIEALSEGLSSVDNLTINIPDKPVKRRDDGSCDINISDIISEFLRRR